MFERFTEMARQVVVMAQEEARALRHNYIGTEHLLLGLLREDRGLAASVLGSLGVTLAEAREEIVRIVSPREEVTSAQIPFSPRAKKVLELALREALFLGHDYIGTEHLLLGLVSQNEGLATRVLLGFGLDAETIRNEVVRQLSSPEGQRRSRASATASVSAVAFTASPDDQLRRLLMAAAGRALIGQRSEFGLADLLAAAKEAGDAPATGPPAAGG